MENEKLARTIQGEVAQATGERVTVSVRNGIAELTGQSGSLQKAVAAGHIAAVQEQVREVINDIDYPGEITIVLPPKISDELTGK
jgi:osmotically-inducible protein OsmY